jgi:hypothetical protein
VRLTIFSTLFYFNVFVEIKQQNFYMKIEMLRIGAVNMELDLDIDAIEQYKGTCDEIMITKNSSRFRIDLGAPLFPRISIEFEQIEETIRAVCKVNEANKYGHVLQAGRQKKPESTSFVSQKLNTLVPIVGGTKSPDRSNIIPNDIGVCYVGNGRLYHKDTLIRSLMRDSVEIL